MAMPRQFMLVAATLVLMLSADAHAQSRLASELPSSRLLARFGLERAWWSQATLDIGRDEVAIHR